VEKELREGKHASIQEKVQILKRMRSSIVKGYPPE
jgi:hypothetical protein